MGRRGRGTRGRAGRREGVTDSYSMHNNWVRLSTCNAPSISLWLSHWRPMETHKHTRTHTSLQRHRRLAASCYTIWLSKLFKKNHTLMPQIPAHMKKVRQADQTQVNKASSYLRDSLNKVHCADMHGHLEGTICLLCSHSLRATHAHTHALTFTETISNYVIGRRVMRHCELYIKPCLYWSFKHTSQHIFWIKYD